MMQKEKWVVRCGEFNKVAPDPIWNLVVRTMFKSKVEKFVFKLPKDLLDSFGPHLVARKSSQSIPTIKSP